MSKKFFDINRIKTHSTKKNAITLAETVLAGAVATIVPAVIQQLGGYDDKGNARINMTGEVPSIATDLVLCGVALAIDKPHMAGGIVAFKACQELYKRVNSTIASVLGTPILPMDRAEVVRKETLTQIASMSDSATTTPTRPMRLSTGQILNVPVERATVDNTYMLPPQTTTNYQAPTNFQAPRYERPELSNTTVDSVLNDSSIFQKPKSNVFLNDSVEEYQLLGLEEFGY